MAELKQLSPTFSSARRRAAASCFFRDLFSRKGAIRRVLMPSSVHPRADGYSSRLFFAEQVQSRTELNWNATGVTKSSNETGTLTHGRSTAPICGSLGGRSPLKGPTMNIRVRLTQQLYREVRANTSPPTPLQPNVLVSFSAG